MATGESPSEAAQAFEDDLFEYLPTPLQQAVARGDVGLSELLERVTSTQASELCPRCAKRPQEVPSGLCRVCWARATVAAHEEYRAEIVAKAEMVNARQKSKRLRDRLGVDPDVGAVYRIGGSAAYGVRRDGSPTLVIGTAIAESIARRLIEEREDR